MAALISPHRLKGAQLIFDLEQTLLLVAINRAQIQQIALNLILNALDALPDGTGRVMVSTGTTNYGRDELATLVVGDTCGPGRFVWFRVQDTGRGIVPGSLRHITEPFFTIKPEGTGLGLANFLSVIRHHRGAYHVQSNVGEGTIIMIWLPAVASTPRSASARITSRF